MKKTFLTILPILSLLYHEVTPTHLISRQNINNFSDKLLQLYENIELHDLFKTQNKLFFELNLFLNTNLPQIGINLPEKLDSIDLKISEDIRHQLPFNSQDFRERSAAINNLYRHFSNLLKGKITRPAIQHFISEALNNKDSKRPEFNAQQIFKIICPGNLKKGGNNTRTCLFNKIADQLNMNVKQRRQYEQNLQQLLYEMFYDTATMEIRAFIMTTTAYKLHSLQTNVDRTSVIKLVKDEHLTRMSNYLLDIYSALGKSSTEITLDPEWLVDYMPLEMLALNVRLKETDHQNNWVVTGIRFVLKNWILHLQLEEGKLLSNGEIQPGSQRWIPIDDMNYYGYAQRRTMTTSTNETIYLRQHFDYYSLSDWDYVGIENFEVPEDHVIVGATFGFKYIRTVGSQKKTWIFIRLKSAPVDLITGKVKSNFTKENDDFLHPSLDMYRRIIKFKNPEDNDEIYLNLGHATKVNKASLISYIDAAPVNGNPRLPLTAIGFYKQFLPRHGSFLSLKIFEQDIFSRISRN